MKLTDKEYVERCRDGHPDDFRVLVDRYQKPLFAYLADRFRNFDAAEEAVQESFVRAFLGLSKLRKPESFFSWLLGIGARVAQEQFRAWKQRETESDIADNSTEADREHDCPLEETIALLPETYRQVILLRYFEGLSCQEIATRLETPLGTVTKNLSRAYALLRHELEARELAE